MIYRFTFNGKKSDHEVKGDRNSYTTEFRQFDPRLGKWLTDDPLTSNDKVGHHTVLTLIIHVQGIKQISTI